WIPECLVLPLVVVLGAKHFESLVRRQDQTPTLKRQGLSVDQSEKRTARSRVDADTVLAHDYPTHAVRLIEPFGAGGGPDLIARALAQKLSELWDQPVTVENVAGAGATAGPAQVANAPADGHTLLVSTSAQAYSAALLND